MAEHELTEEPRSVESLAQLADATAELQALGAPFSYAASPAALPAAAFAAMESLWRTFAAGVSAFVSSHDGKLAAMAAALRLPEEIAVVADALPETGWGVIGRPDVIVSSGQPRIVDVNVEGLAGLFPLNDNLLRTHLAPGLRDEFRQPAMAPRFLMGHYADILRRFARCDTDLIALTIFASEVNGDHDFGRWHYELTIRELARVGLTADLVFLEDLEITKSGVFAGGRRVGLIHRFFEPRLDDAEELAGVARIAAAARDGLVPVFSGLQELILSNKSTLAVLSDERFTDELPRSLTGQLEQVIPWTRILEERHTRWRGSRIDLLPWAQANRESLLLKPALGYWGVDVLAGRELSPGQWSALMNSAVAGKEPWVVQEVLKPDEEYAAIFDGQEVRSGRFPVVYGAYILDNQFAGAICRYGIRGSRYVMINGTVGAVPAPVYWRS
ncbi:MAG TPA: hypothetical protein VFQ44_25135 [Streptosporangiaceae bacterium]|nr:hypothetical protein [Streptosporangiaceae bacterium]